jgi:hypothetical protein
VALVGARWDRDLAELSRFRQFVLLRPRWLVSRASLFKRADISVLLAYFELDLRGVHIEKAVVNVTAICGRVDVLVDDHVVVREWRPFVLGRNGITLRTDDGPPNAPLSINVLGVFGTARCRKPGSRSEPTSRPQDGDSARGL